MVSVSWTFRNEHNWSKTFPNEDTAMEFVVSVGLVSHPDIVSIVVKREAGVDICLKRGVDF